MGIILYFDKWQFALVYQDEIVIFSKLPDEHIDDVQLILTLLNNAEVKVMLKSSNSSLGTKIILPMSSSQDGLP